MMPRERIILGEVVDSDEILLGCSPKIRAIAERLRKLVREAVPEMTEKALPGWRAIGLRHPHSGHVGAIFPQHDSVQFAFEHGVLLADPEGLLRIPPTTGKQVRYYVVSDEAEIQEAAFEQLILEAVAVRARTRTNRR